MAINNFSCCGMLCYGIGSSIVRYVVKPVEFICATILVHLQSNDRPWVLAILSRQNTAFRCQHNWKTYSINMGNLRLEQLAVKRAPLLLPQNFRKTEAAAVYGRAT